MFLTNRTGAASREFPVSANQLRYILAETLTDANYMQPASWLIEGPLDTRRFKAAIRQVVARHEMLRVEILHRRGHGYLNRVHDRVDVEIDERSLPGGDDEAIRSAILECAYRPHGLRNRDLVRFQLIRLGPDRHVFTTLLHHTVTDAVSGAIFRRELSVFYSGEVPETIPVSYGDVFRRSDAVLEQRLAAQAFWRDYLANFDGVGSLHADFAPQTPSYTMDFVEYRLDAAASTRVRDTARQLGVSPFVLVSTSYSLLLGWHTGANSVLSLFQSAGRRPYAGSENTIGLFSNALALVTRWNDAMSFAELARSTRSSVGRCLRNEIVPYQEVVSASGLKARLGINWMPGDQALALADCRVARRNYVFAQSDHDLNFRIVENGETLLLLLAFNRSLYLRDRVADFGRQLLDLLETVGSDPTLSVSALRRARPRRAIPRPRDPDPAEAAGERIHDAFLRQLALRPEATALEFSGRRWSYQDLDQASRSIALRIRRHAPAPGATVAILARRTPGLVAAVLAILRLGCAFAILDSAYPPRRLRQCVDALQPVGIIACEGQPFLDELVPGVADPAWFLFALDEDAAPPPCDTGADSTRGCSDEDAAYYLFTSGTTGLPKCVSASHRPLVHFLRWQARQFGLDESARVTMISGLGHDPVLRDIFLPLSIGATLLLPDAGTERDAKKLFGWMAASAPTVCHLTPQIGHLVLGGVREGRTLPSLHHLFWGGDVLTGQHLLQFAQVAPQARSVNFYGATETPQAFGWFPVAQGQPWRLVPIGRGIPGVELFVEDGAGGRSACGEYGQIVARSSYLSNGYVRSDAEGREEASGFAGDRYEFGDYGYTLPEGDIVCLGRRDAQVKIRGYRVELAEISRALEELDGVAKAYAAGVAEDGEDARLVAYVELARGHEVTRGELQRHLRHTLPRYMVPDYYVPLPELPLMPNGKIDRKQLPPPQKCDLAEQRRYEPPRSQLERELIADWEEILQLEGIGAADSFVDLGGDSLSYVAAHLSLERRLGSVPHDWGSRSIRDLAALSGRKGIVRMLDTSILIRACAIVLIIAGHKKLFSFATGSTGALFLVTGYLLSQFQVPQILSHQGSKPLLRLAGKILLPVLAYTLLITLVGSAPHPSMILLSSNFFEFRTKGVQVHIWYVHALLQMLLLLALFMTSPRLRHALSIRPYVTCVLLFLVLATIRFLSPALASLLDDGAVMDFAHPVYYLPTTHLATLVLGMSMYFSNTWRERAYTLLLLCGYWILTETVFQAPYTMLMLFGVLLLYVREVPVIPPVKQVTYMLAGASLFIYLTEPLWVNGLGKVGIELHSSALKALVCLVGGVLAWACWNRLRFLVSKLRNRRDDSVVIDTV